MRYGMDFQRRGFTSGYGRDFGFRGYDRGFGYRGSEQGRGYGDFDRPRDFGGFDRGQRFGGYDRNQGYGAYDRGYGRRDAGYDRGFRGRGRSQWNTPTPGMGGINSEPYPETLGDIQRHMNPYNPWVPGTGADLGTTPGMGGHFFYK